MTTIFFPTPTEETDGELCCYFNPSDRVVIARITNIPNCYCERVIFPQERFMFIAPPEAELEIHHYSQIGLTHDIISCTKLRIQENSKLTRI